MKDSMKLVLTELIKEKRIELGYSQEDLAKLMGFKSRTSIFKIEKGITNLTLNQLIQLVKILKLNLEIKLGGENVIF